MKMLLIVLVTFMSIAVSAQKIELSLAGGFSTNSKASPAGPYSGAKGGSGYAVQMKVRAVVRSLAVGVGTDVQQMKIHNDAPGFDAYGNPTEQRYERTITVGNPVINVYALADRYINFKRLSINIGIIGGASFARSTGGLQPASGNYPNGNGFLLGATAGAGFKVARSLSVAVEASPRYHAMNAVAPIYRDTRYNLFSLPVTAGLRYRL